MTLGAFLNPVVAPHIYSLISWHRRFYWFYEFCCQLNKITGSICMWSICTWTAFRSKDIKLWSGWFILSRKRTLVAIGTHDLDTLEGPFTYEASFLGDIFKTASWILLIVTGAEWLKLCFYWHKLLNVLILECTPLTLRNLDGSAWFMLPLATLQLCMTNLTS